MKTQIRIAFVFVLMLALAAVAFAQDDAEEGDMDIEISATFVQQAQTATLAEDQLTLEVVSNTSAIFEIEDDSVFYQYDNFAFISSFQYADQESGESTTFTAVLTTTNFEMTLELAPIPPEEADLDEENRLSTVSFEIVEFVSGIEYFDEGELVNLEIDKFDDFYGDYDGASLFISGGADLFITLETGYALFLDDNRGTRTVSCVPNVSC